MGAKTMQFDIIGDIHGHADKLVMLLEKLGYRDTGRGYAHPDRTAVFVMDLIDRGGQQRKTLSIVRKMVEEKKAVAAMGNHEFNAIAFSLPDPNKPGEFLRPHNHKNRHGHAAFLEQCADDPAYYADTIKWFLTLPLWLDLPGFRVVHACWHQPSIDIASGLLLPGNRLSHELMVEASREGSPLFNAVEMLLKGPEVALPAGCEVVDTEGNTRRRSRIRWWDHDARTYRSAAIVPPAVAEKLPLDRIPEESLIHYDNRKPVFFGHYWMTGKPRLLGARLACLDYSAARHGDLVAYCWDGEEVLRPERFFSSGMSIDLVPPAFQNADA